MPKLRNSTTDIGQFTQWLARKCRNHPPIAEMVKPAKDRQKLRSTYRETAKIEKLAITGDRENRIVYSSGGRTFLITVDEMTGNEVTVANMLKDREVQVGY